MKKIFLSLVLLLGCSVYFISTAAAYTAFQGHFDDMTALRANWMAAAGISAPDTTVDFESYGHGEDLLGDNVSGMVITSTKGDAYVSNDISSFGGSNPIDDKGLAIDEGDDYLFSFDAPITYLAFYMFDQSATNMTINYADTTTESISIDSSGASGYNGIFLGLVFDSAVTSVYIPNLKGGDGKVGIDNIEFGAASVPVPSAFLLFGIGLFGLAGVSRKR